MVMKASCAFVALVPLVSGAERRTTPRQTAPRACAASNLSRRDALRLGGLAAAGAAGSALYLPSSPSFAADPQQAGPLLELPPLPYGYNALEPVIDRETMVLHHDKHFAKYTEGTNKALAKIPGALADVEGNPAKLAEYLGDLDSIKDEKVRLALRQNGGGFVNHYQFFATMGAPNYEIGRQGPLGDIGGALFVGFGSYPRFQQEFTKKALALFGSGFVYLVRERTSRKLAIKSYANQDSPLMFGDLPLLGLDLWEHAYYKKYANRRAEYVDAWYNIINWDVVTKTYKSPVTPDA